MGEQVDVEGHTLYLESIGTGKPTVVLQSGFGNAGDVWTISETGAPGVQPELGTTNRVCSYDRPGSQVMTTIRDGLVVPGDSPQPGRSGTVPMPRHPVAVVTELHDLLAAAAVPGPYVMVGHSLGGAFSVLYTHSYPDEVCALVVVDSPLPPLRARVSPATWEELHIMKLGPSHSPGYELESYDLNEVFDDIEAAKPFRDIPVVVVRRGDGVKFNDDEAALPEGFPLSQAEIDASNVVQWEAQAVWAESVPGAEVITVPGTTHYVQTQRPEVVVSAVRAAIARI
jgi:pimeloyl-ACP methyl ester carboxylesterase